MGLDKLSRQYPKSVIPSVYIGGGTPSFLAKPVLSRLLDAVSRFLRDRSPCREWTVEANPSDITADFLCQLRQSGVDRLSLGVQSFQQEVLSLLGRSVPVNAASDALDLIAQLWDRRLSVDMIHSVPGQTAEQIQADGVELLRRNIPHISWYALSIEEGTPLQSRCSPSVSAPDHQSIVDRLTSRMGLPRYEISNYAREGEESLHNLRYWNLDPWVGLGPGAVSMIPGEGSCPVRFTLDRHGLPEKTEQIVPIELYKEIFMMGLRTRRGVNLDRVSRIFGFNPLDPIRLFLQKYRDLIDLTDKVLALKGPGLDISNRLLVDLFIEVEGFTFPERNIDWPISSLD